MKIELIGYRDVAGRFAQRTQMLHQAKTDMAHEQGQHMRDALRHYAPKVTGLFAEGITHRVTEPDARTIQVAFYATGPHAFVLPFLTQGTRPHDIYPRGPWPLRFYWVRGPNGPGIYFYYHVRHPGTMPQEFVDSAVQSQEPQMLQALHRVAERVAWLA